ncbi:Lipopolysaccharide biosynthesis protein WzzE [Candidatus Providencia siddallii]|uniref:Lipopolysaccharide biosynthesis protein WzzE n=1 Tax=Candidatus Providencia siddallii TaxID=1715285 RepID=A0A0M6W8L4_9GAMM|nr:Lipopolysaccharide biosynthesis protein WzzE [Candidatus Providencia siddallii]
MDNTSNNQNQYSTEYDLDIRNLCRFLCKKKILIITFAFISSLIALVVSYFIQPKWTATAITCAPTVNNLGSYYFNKRFLYNLDLFINKITQDEKTLTITKEVYQEFIKQLGSYDTRRQFWLNNNYYKNRLPGNYKKASILLDDLINNIEFIPADELRNTTDSIKLTADTSEDSNRLLRDYIEFVNKRAINNLNNEIKSIWKAETQYVNFLIKYEDVIFKDLYKKNLNLIKKSLKIIERKNIIRNDKIIPLHNSLNSGVFMLDMPFFKSQVESLINISSNHNANYDNKVIILSKLNEGFFIKENFKSFRYLKTPEDPIERESPRRVFMMVLWGTIGLLITVGVIMFRRTPY